MHIALTPRSLGLVLALAAAAGWYEAVTVNDTPQQPPRAVAARQVHQGRSADTRVPNTEKLRQRMPAPPQPGSGRNPFVYGSRAAARSDARTEAVNVAPETAMAMDPPPPAVPVVRLSGIASNAENGVTVLTAILNDNGTMVIAKAGDKLSNGYSVVRVDEGSVTLVDAAGVTQTIKLP